MSLYTVALFLRVSGAIGAFISLGIWLFGLAALRLAKLVEQVRALAWLIIIASPLMVGSVLLLGLAGFRMALSTWGLSTPWIAVSLASVVLIAPIGAFVLDPRMRTILVMALASLLGLVSSIPFWYAARKLPQQTAPHGNHGEDDPFLRTTIWTRRW